MDHFQPKDAMQCINDDTLGPIVRGCRDEFDFTKTFEQTLLSLFASVVFILVAATRMTRLAKRPTIFSTQKLPPTKGFTALTLFVLNLLLVIATNLRTYGGKFSMQAAAVAATASGILIPLSMLEHVGALKPSTPICVYLSISLLCDAVQIRTSFLSDEPSFSALLVAIAVFKFLLLLLEEKNKQNLLSPGVKKLSPERTSSPISKSFFWWLNELIRRGYTEQLEADDLYPLDSQLDAEKHQARFFLAYKTNHPKRNDIKAGPWNLIRALVSTLRTGLVAPVPARVAVGVFAFSQPFFINSMLSYLQDGSKSTSNAISLAYVGIIGFLYVGSAVSSGVYWYYHQRALLGLRSCLVTAIYRKTIYRKTYSSENAAAITLMNSEVNIVQSGLYSFHEFWASIIETAVASWLLQRQIGAAFVSPLIIVLLCTMLVLGIGRFASKRQGQWMESLGRRVGLTSLVIPNMPAIKMSGLGNQVGRLIQQSREKEISSANRFRVLLAFSATISFVPVVLAPIVTFTLSSGSLTITKVFTSLAFINLLCNPFIHVLQNATQLLAAITSLSRIQKFLDSEAHDEVASAVDRYSDQDTGEQTQAEDMCVMLSEASFSWTNAKQSVANVNFSINSGSQTLVAGPVGAGKTTLCLGLLKETPYAGGLIHMKSNSRVAYCSQDPFILNGTIRDNIVGFADYETNWYSKVVECCQLVEDFSILAQGDETKVGSKGIALSGGQRKRISLARAVYSRPEIAILDDVFGGIDTNTAREIERKVFSHEGVFRQIKTAVLLCSQSTDQAMLFDKVVVLRDGIVAWCGSPIELPSDYGIASKPTSEAQEWTHSLNISDKNDEPESTTSQTTVAPPNERVLRPPGGSANYRFYFSAVGFKVIALYFVLVSVAAFLFSSSALWLELWVQHQNDESKESFYFLMYWALQLTCVALLSVYFVFCDNVMSPRASSRLHFGTLKTILSAPLDYYTTVDSSVPTGYMSQDMSVLDTTFTRVFANTVVSIFITGFQSIIISLASPLILAAYPVFLGMLYFVQKVYLRTSTQLRFLAMETREPLFKHFIETIEGLATLRAFGWKDANIALNIQLLNESQRSSYLVQMHQRWLSLMISLSVALVATIFVALASQYPTSAGFVGVALINLMSFGEMLGNLIGSYAELQNSAVALSRLRLVQESVVGEDEQDGREKDTPAKAWPEKGNIQIDGVSAAYEANRSYPGKQPFTAANDTITLRNVSLEIKSGEHVIVCGRTGSGKSTLLLLLQGFLTPRSGRLTIDNLQPRNLHRAALRDRIMALPQVPFFLSDEYTVRDNLEYHSEDQAVDFDSVAHTKYPAQDTDSEYALRVVGLWELLEARGGLDAQLREDSLSRGQKQLFSLARAILRQRLRRQLSSSSLGGVLLLDEFNTGLDKDTEKLMWEVIKAEFAGVTIVCVAHRLGAAADFDKVVVLSKGQVVEQGRPSELLADSSSKFHAIWTAGNN